MKRPLQSVLLELASAAWHVAVVTGITLSVFGILHLTDGNPATKAGVILLSAGAAVLLLRHPARIGLRELRTRWDLDRRAVDMRAAIRERAVANAREARDHAPRILLP